MLHLHLQTAAVLQIRILQVFHLAVQVLAVRDLHRGEDEKDLILDLRLERAEIMDAAMEDLDLSLVRLLRLLEEDRIGLDLLLRRKEDQDHLCLDEASQTFHLRLVEQDVALRLKSRTALVLQHLGRYLTELELRISMMMRTAVHEDMIKEMGGEKEMLRQGKVLNYQLSEFQCIELLKLDN